MFTPMGDNTVQYVTDNMLLVTCSWAQCAILMHSVTITQLQYHTIFIY